MNKSLIFIELPFAFAISVMAAVNPLLILLYAPYKYTIGRFVGRRALEGEAIGLLRFAAPSLAAIIFTGIGSVLDAVGNKDLIMLSFESYCSGVFLSTFGFSWSMIFIKRSRISIGINIKYGLIMIASSACTYALYIACISMASFSSIAEPGVIDVIYRTFYVSVFIAPLILLVPLSASGIETWVLLIVYRGR